MRAALLCIGVLASSMLSACVGGDETPQEQLLVPGGIELALTVGGAAINSVSYEITRPGFATLSGAIEVTDPLATASAFIGGLPAASGYSMKLQAASTDGLTTCEGQASFDVFAALTTALTLRMDCRKKSDRGGVAVTVTTNFCPQIKLLVISPTQAAFGKSIQLQATVEDPDGPPPAVVWSSMFGTFANTAAAKTMYTCTKAGQHTLTLQISDGSCSDTFVGRVECLPCGGADVDKNGVLDCEETLIKNGEFPTNTANWASEAGITNEFFMLDADQSPTSGSLRINNSIVADSPGVSLAGVNQCVTVVPGATYLLFNQAFIPAGQGPGSASNSLFFFANPDCTGEFAGVFSSPEASVTNTWTKLITRPVAPANAKSVRLRLVVSKPFRRASLQVLFDNVLFRRE